MDFTKKVGIMGGTFDPIHIGHLLLAETAWDYFALDELLFIPSGHSYMKENVTDMAARTAMTHKAIGNNPHFFLSEIEINRTGDTYSYETVMDLAKLNPSTQYYFIIGADTLFSIEAWKHPELLFANCIIAAAVRKGYSTKALTTKINLLKHDFKADIRLFTTSRIDISSTEIRSRLKKGLSIQYMVPEKVLEYITKNNLYR